MHSEETLILSIDAMGGDHAPDSIMNGLSLVAADGLKVRFLIHGDEAKLKPFLDADSRLKACSELQHTEKAIAMDAKPSQAVRQGKGSSMWNTLAAVKSGEAHIAVAANSA